MSKLSLDEMKKLALLSRFDMTDDELNHFRQEIESILQYIDLLESVDVDGIEPTYQVHGLSNVTRQDTEISYGTTRVALLKNAPHEQNNYFKVKRMVG